MGGGLMFVSSFFIRNVKGFSVVPVRNLYTTVLIGHSCFNKSIGSAEYRMWRCTFRRGVFYTTARAMAAKAMADEPDQPNTNSDEDYDFEELLRNIRKKTAEKREKLRDKVKRDENSLMSIEELTAFLQVENAQDVCVIKIPPEKKYVDYMVICSGHSTRHISKMATELASEMRHVKVWGDYTLRTDHRRVVVEGEKSEDWMAVDIGNIVVHFMLNSARKFHQIEKLWTLGQEYDDMSIEIRKYLMEQDERLYY